MTTSILHEDFRVTRHFSTAANGAQTLVPESYVSLPSATRALKVTPALRLLRSVSSQSGTGPGDLLRPSTYRLRPCGFLLQSLSFGFISFGQDDGHGKADHRDPWYADANLRRLPLSEHRFDRQILPTMP